MGLASVCMQGAQSVSTASKNGRNDGKEYASNLLERIDDKDNLNLPYKQVKAGRGSHESYQEATAGAQGKESKP